jgi:hypothetical protein
MASRYLLTQHNRGKSGSRISKLRINECQAGQDAVWGACFSCRKPRPKECRQSLEPRTPTSGEHWSHQRKQGVRRKRCPVAHSNISPSGRKSSLGATSPDSNTLSWEKRFTSKPPPMLCAMKCPSSRNVPSSSSVNSALMRLVSRVCRALDDLPNTPITRSVIRHRHFQSGVNVADVFERAMPKLNEVRLMLDRA